MCEKTGQYFLIAILFSFFLVIYVSFDPRFLLTKETFRNSNNAYASAYTTPAIDEKLPVFLNSHTGDVYQGVGIPLKYKPPKEETMYDIDMPSVNGLKDGPKSMFMFAYNKCSPECCKDSPYSCSGGCVCLTDNQYNYLDTRGNNREPNKCHFEGKH